MARQRRVFMPHRRPPRLLPELCSPCFPTRTEHSPVKRVARIGSRSTATEVVTAVVASCGLVCLATACASNASPAQTAQGAASSATSTPSAVVTAAGPLQASPSFLPAAAFPAGHGSLPLLADAPTGTASLPWLLVAHNQNSGKLTIETVHGNCTGAAEGYTASEPAHLISRICAVRRVGTRPRAEGRVRSEARRRARRTVIAGPGERPRLLSTAGHGGPAG